VGRSTIGARGALARVAILYLGIGIACGHVAAADTHVASLPPNQPGDASKWTGSEPDKLPHVPKIKECCGYPLSEREGFRLSFYWLAYESEYANLAYDTDIYTRSGFFLGRYPSAFVYELKLEGTGVLNDGRVINYDGECGYGMGTCFRTLDLAQHPLGTGVQGRPLVPFRSVAVDPRFVPIGATLYVPELVGIQMPDGTRHDGCLRADDMGGAIKEHKLDFFVESYFNFKYIADNLWWRMKATPHVDEPRCAYLALGQPRERDNERSDWGQVHAKWRQARAKERAALAKVHRNRQAAQRWLDRQAKKAPGKPVPGKKR
jgi:3D (Asp-Asp-Asp) domain-containing protein